MSDWHALLGEQAPLAMGLLVALGGGLLVGLERERRKGQGPGREAAGLRSFALVSVAGALAHGLAWPCPACCPPACWWWAAWRP